MKKHRNKIRLLLAFVIITVLRETGVLDFHYYQSSIRSSLSSNWQSGNNSVNTLLEVNEIWQSTINDSCNFGGDPRRIPVSVRYEQASYGDTTHCNKMDIIINDISFGNIWTPLYKSSQFSTSVFCNSSISVVNNEHGKVNQRNYLINGSITINGTATITGICSYRNAKAMIVQHVLQQVYNEAVKRVQNL